MYTKDTFTRKARDVVCITAGVILLVVLSILPSIVWGEEDPEPKDFRCPFSQISDQDKCFECHGKGQDFKRIKETSIHDLRSYPTHLIIYADDAGEYGQYTMNGTINHWTWENLDNAFHYLARHNVNRAIIDIDSYGGGLFDGWKTADVILGWQANGMDITTRVRTIAASAAFIIFCAPDNRLIAPTAQLMQHELWTFKMLSIDTPSDKEHEALILRHIQDTVTVWLAHKSGMKKTDLADKLRKKEYWTNGVQAKHAKWATGYTTPIDPELEDMLLTQVERF